MNITGCHVPLNREIKGLCFALGVIGIAAGSYGLGQRSPQMVVIDMKRAINQPAVLLSKTASPANRQGALLSRYSALLPEAIKAYGKAHRVTVVAAPVLVSQGQVDITNIIIAETLVRLKQHD